MLEPNDASDKFTFLLPLDKPLLLLDLYEQAKRFNATVVSRTSRKSKIFLQLSFLSPSDFMGFKKEYNRITKENCISFIVPEPVYFLDLSDIARNSFSGKLVEGLQCSIISEGDLQKPKIIYSTTVSFYTRSALTRFIRLLKMFYTFVSETEEQQKEFFDSIREV